MSTQPARPGVRKAARRGAAASSTAARAELRPRPWDARARWIAPLGLIVADTLAWLVSVGLIYGIRAAIWGALPFLWVTWATSVVWLIFRASSGLYPPYGISQPEEVRRSFLTTMGAVLTHGAVLLALQEDTLWRVTALGLWVFVLPLAWFARSFVKTWLIRRRLFGEPTVVIGTGPRARTAIREMKENPEVGLLPVAAFGDFSEQWGTRIEGVPILGPTAEAETYPFPYPVRHAMVALSRAEMGPEALASTVNRTVQRFRIVNIFPDLRGIANLWAGFRPLGPYLVMETRHARFSRRQRLIKRSFDLAVGIPVFLVALPVIALCALLVKVFSPGPSFFSQEREGQGGDPIRIWKIRTMVPNAEQRLAEYLANDPDARFEWERFLKLRKDPRIIPVVGGFLRKFSLDELPQLWSVIRGDLTLVGPRVFAIWHVERFPADFRALRHQVPPGLTGLWQVSFRNSGDLTVQERVDSYYIHNWSIWLDIWILFRTVRVVLLGSGAY